MVKNADASESPILFWQHCPVGKGTYLRAYEIGRRLATAEHPVWIAAVDPARTSGGVVVQDDPEAPHVKLVLFPGPPNGKDGLVQMMRRVILARWWGLFHAPKFALGHFFALGHPFNGLSCEVLAWFKCTRRLIDWDDLWGHGFGVHAGLVTNTVLRVLERWVPRIIKADRATTVSHYLAGQCQEIGFAQGHIHLIGNGFNAEPVIDASSPGLRERFEISSDHPLAVSVGNTYSPQSLEAMLAAFKLAMEQRPELRLVLLGDFHKPGRLGESIKDILARYADLMGRSVIEAGSVPESVMHAHLREADFVILPMDEGLADRARFPIRLGPYLAHRKLIVSNASGEVERILSGASLGLLCPPKDIPAFTANIVLACTQHVDYASRNAAFFDSLLTSYSWDTLANKWQGVYSSGGIL